MNQNQEGVLDGMVDLSTGRLAELINIIFNDTAFDNHIVATFMADGPENDAIVLDDLKNDIANLTPTEFDEVLGNSGLGSVLVQKPKGDPV